MSRTCETPLEEFTRTEPPLCKAAHGRSVLTDSAWVWPGFHQPQPYPSGGSQTRLGISQNRIIRITRTSMQGIYTTSKTPFGRRTSERKSESCTCRRVREYFQLACARLVPNKEDRRSIGPAVAEVWACQKRFRQGRAAHTDIFPLCWKDFARSLRSLARNKRSIMPRNRITYLQDIILTVLESQSVKNQQMATISVIGIAIIWLNSCLILHTSKWHVTRFLLPSIQNCIFTKRPERDL